MPGKTYRQRINYTFDTGADLLVRTVRDDLGIDVNHYVEVSLQSFARSSTPLVGSRCASPAPARDAWRRGTGRRRGGGSRRRSRRVATPRSQRGDGAALAPFTAQRPAPRAPRAAVRHRRGRSSRSEHDLSDRRSRDPAVPTVSLAGTAHEGATRPPFPRSCSGLHVRTVRPRSRSPWPILSASRHRLRPPSVEASLSHIVTTSWVRHHRRMHIFSTAGLAVVTAGVTISGCSSSSWSAAALAPPGGSSSVAVTGAGGVLRVENGSTGSESARDTQGASDIVTTSRTGA